MAKGCAALWSRRSTIPLFEAIEKELSPFEAPLSKPYKPWVVSCNPSLTNPGTTKSRLRKFRGAKVQTLKNIAQNHKIFFFTFSSLHLCTLQIFTIYFGCSGSVGCENSHDLPSPLPSQNNARITLRYCCSFFFFPLLFFFLHFFFSSSSAVVQFRPVFTLQPADYIAQILAFTSLSSLCHCHCRRRGLSVPSPVPVDQKTSLLTFWIKMLKNAKIFQKTNLFWEETNQSTKKQTKHMGEKLSSGKAQATSYFAQNLCSRCFAWNLPEWGTLNWISVRGAPLRSLDTYEDTLFRCMNLNDAALLASKEVACFACLTHCKGLLLSEWRSGGSSQHACAFGRPEIEKEAW